MPESAESLPATPDQTATPAKPDESQASVEKPTSLYDLLRDDDPAPERAEPGQAPERASKAEPPKGLHDLAERLGVKPADLYAIEIPMSEGESLTLGKLKDLARETGDLTERELRFEEDKSRREGELIRAQQELQTLMSSLPKGAIKPEVMEQVRRKHEATLKRERALTLEAIPEWRDVEKRTEEISGMVEHLQGYGFPASYLESLTDHRTLRYVRDNWRREQRIRKALEKVEKAKPPASTKSKPNGPAKAPGQAPRSRNPDNRSRLLALLDD